MDFSQNIPKSIFLYSSIKRFYLGECPKNEKVYRMMILMIERDIDFLRYNKALVAVGELLNKCYSYTNDILNHRIHRYRMYYESAIDIFHHFNNENIRAICIKTFDIAPKDVADIDIILYGRKDLENAERVLSKLGYRKRKSGSEQHLWTTIRDGVIVDIELHSNVAAAGYIYYPKDILFKRAKKQDDIIVPSPIDSILLLVAHAILKDFYATLMDLLNFELTLIKHSIDLKTLKYEAKSLGLEIPLKAFLHMLYPFSANYIYDDHIISRILTFKKIQGYPVRPYLHTVLLSYIYLTIEKLKKEPLRSVLAQITSLPSGKGIDYFVRFMFFGKPPIKGFSE